MTNTLDQLTILAQRLIDELAKERAEIEALRRSVQTREEDIIRRNETLLKERSNVLAQVDSIRKEKEANQAQMNAAAKLKAQAVEQSNRNDDRKFLLDAQEKEIIEKKKGITKLDEREKMVKELEAQLENERAFIRKQKELLDEKEMVQKIRGDQLTEREARVARLYS